MACQCRRGRQPRKFRESQRIADVEQPAQAKHAEREEPAARPARTIREAASLKIVHARHAPQQPAAAGFEQHEPTRRREANPCPRPRNDNKGQRRDERHGTAPASGGGARQHLAFEGDAPFQAQRQPLRGIGQAVRGAARQILRQRQQMNSGSATAARTAPQRSGTTARSDACGELRGAPPALSR